MKKPGLPGGIWINPGLDSGALSWQRSSFLNLSITPPLLLGWGSFAYGPEAGITIGFASLLFTSLAFGFEVILTSSIVFDWTLIYPLEDDSL